MSQENNLRSYFLNLIKRRDYTELEMRKKAKERGYDPEDIEKIVQEFKDYKYIDDARFCESVITSYQGKKGKKWIYSKMKMAGVDSELINKSLETLPDNFMQDGFKEYVMRKYKLDTFQDLDMKTKSKVLNFLAYRGFKNPFEILNDWINN